MDLEKMAVVNRFNDNVYRYLLNIQLILLAIRMRSDNLGVE